MRLKKIFTEKTFATNMTGSSLGAFMHCFDMRIERFIGGVNFSTFITLMDVSTEPFDLFSFPFCLNMIRFDVSTERIKRGIHSSTIITLMNYSSELLFLGTFFFHFG